METKITKMPHPNSDELDLEEYADLADQVKEIPNGEYVIYRNRDSDPIFHKNLRTPEGETNFHNYLLQMSEDDTLTSVTYVKGDVFTLISEIYEKCYISFIPLSDNTVFTLDFLYRIKDQKDGDSSILGGDVFTVKGKEMFFFNVEDPVVYVKSNSHGLVAVYRHEE